MKSKLTNEIKETGGHRNRLFVFKMLTALWLGKLLLRLTRLTGRGGTTLPGRTALKINPDIASQLTGQLTGGSLLITGTNGKTTTSALVSTILKENGCRYIHNYSGSNMIWGITSTLIEASTPTGRLEGNWAVMEVDEGAFPSVVHNLRPHGIVVTNIFRDQLDRYGEIDQIQGSIGKGLQAQPEEGFQVLNADDPSLVMLDSGVAKRMTYGLETELQDSVYQNTGRDIKVCPACHKMLEYTIIYFAHLGHYYCPSCNYRRPKPDIKLNEHIRNSDGTAHLRIGLPDDEFTLNFPLLGTYNLYNVLAAVACSYSLFVPIPVIKRALERVVPSFGRMERFTVNNKTMIMALIKNPVSTNEVLRTILNEPGRINLVVAINDKIADGTDISWLWDVSFEELAAVKERLSTVFVSGLRALEMAVRLKYAGLDPGRFEITEDTGRAIKSALEQTASGDKLYILPTYTAMLEMHRYINRMGLGKPYWED